MKRAFLIASTIIAMSLPLASYVCTWGWHNDNCGPLPSGVCMSACSQDSSPHTTLSACNMQYDDNYCCQCKQFLYHCNHPTGGSCNPGNIAVLSATRVAWSRV